MTPRTLARTIATVQAVLLLLAAMAAAALAVLSHRADLQDPDAEFAGLGVVLFSLGAGIALLWALLLGIPALLAGRSRVALCTLAVFEIIAAGGLGVFLPSWLHSVLHWGFAGLAFEASAVTTAVAALVELTDTRRTTHVA